MALNDTLASDLDSPFTTKPSAQSLVSWQSAFWGVIAILLTTIAQNSGAVLYRPYQVRVGLRALPIICALDSLCVLIKFAAMLVIGCSPRTAAQHVWWDRFPVESNRTASGFDGSAWSLSIWAFLLGALPQTIKIYGMRGIPFTQAITSIYMTSFVIMEALRIIAGPFEDEFHILAGSRDLLLKRNVKIAKKWIKIMANFFALFGDRVQLLVTALILMNITPEVGLYIASYPPIEHLVSLLISIPIICLVLWVAITLFWKTNCWENDTRKTPRPFLIIQKLSSVLLYTYWFPVAIAHYYFKSAMPENQYNSIRIIGGALLTMSILCMSVLFYAFILFLIRISLFKPMITLFGIYGNDIMMELSVIAILNYTFLSLFGYYVCVYNPQGTMKPSWTDVLG